MQTSGTESIFASAIPVTRFVAPGPLVAKATPTFPLTRATPSAPQTSPCPSCSLQPALWQTIHLECGREFLSLLCEFRRRRLSRRESNRHTRPYWKSSSACGQVRLHKLDQRSASSHADTRNKRFPAHSQPRPEFRILS